MRIQNVNKDFGIAGQIRPADIAAIAEAGYKTIVCARPDNEGFRQPTFAEVAGAAESAGLKTAHIPVQGMLTEGNLIRFEQAWKDLPKPMLCYCQSGARAGSLYVQTVGC